MARTTPRARASTVSAVARVLACAALLAGAPAVQAEQPPGNAANPPSLEPRGPRDPRGLSALQPERRRTPSGFLYPYPDEPAAYRALGGGWSLRGSAEVGVFWETGEDDEAAYQRYTDWDDGAVLNALSLDLLNEERGDYFELFGGAVGRDDQFYRLEAGRAGLLRVLGSFTRSPITYADDAIILFRGVGSESLKLSGDPGMIDLAGEVAASGQSTLRSRRDQTRLSLDLKLRPELELFARYGLMERDGERPFGGALSFPVVTSFVGGVVETATPVQDRSHDVSAGLRWADERFQTNLTYSGSFYRNDDDRLAFDYPFDLGVDIERGRFAAAPDNDLHRLSADVALELPWHARFTGTVSWTAMRQDEDLLPPTINDVTVAGIANWNTTAALSDDHADASIDTWLVDASLELRPWRAVRIKGRYRYYDRDNDTDYVASNPAGALGYLVEDGGQGALFGADLSGVLQPGSQNFPFRNAGYDVTRQNYELALSYRVNRATVLEVAYEGEYADLDDRERDRTREDRVRASVSSRMRLATLRLSYEYASRNVDSFDPDYRTPFMFSSLPGYVPAVFEPAGLRQLQRPDLADRDQQIASLRLNLFPGNSSDLSLVALYQGNSYADYGLESDRQTSVNLDWGYQPSPEASFYAYGMVEWQKSEVSNIRGEPGATPDFGDANAGGSAYPLANSWSTELQTTTYAFGMGLSLQLMPRLMLEGDYSFIQTREDIDYDFASPAAAAGGAPVGDDFPHLRRREQILETSLRFSVRENLAIRFYQRFEHVRIDDWAETTLVALNGNRLFFARRADDYNAAIYGVSVQMSF